MLDGPLIFVDIDTQRDFLDPSGALFVAGSEAILGHLEELTRFAREHRIPVLATACSHELDDAELSVFPPHCLAGTPGQARVAATAWDGSVVIGTSQEFTATITAHLTLEKSEFDVFSRPDADRVISLYNARRPTFVVYGVATDYCVKAAVLGLLRRGCKVVVVVDAVRAVDPEHECEVLGEFIRRGAVLTLTDVVCNLAPDHVSSSSESVADAR